MFLMFSIHLIKICQKSRFLGKVFLQSKMTALGVNVKDGNTLTDLFYEFLLVQALNL